MNANHNSIKLSMSERVRLAQELSDNAARERMNANADRLQRSLERADAMFKQEVSNLVYLDNRPLLVRAAEERERRRLWKGLGVALLFIAVCVGTLAALWVLTGHKL